MNNIIQRLICAALLGLVVAGCAKAPLASISATERASLETSLMRDIRVLASDEYGGRKPGTAGERLTTDYIISNLQAAGFESGTNDPGNAWRAPVELVSVRPQSGSVTFEIEGKSLELEPDEAVVFTNRARDFAEGADVVFVGYEAEDITDEMVAGKVVIMLGEPGKSPQRREILGSKRPAAILTTLDDASGINNYRRAIGRENLSRASEEQEFFGGFVSNAALARVLGDETWLQLRGSADEEEFSPVTLNAKATIEATSQRREFTSHNVIGRLPGSVPGAGAVLMLGHWDHLGECGPPEAEDRICNGAVDNASGISVMLELARRLAATGPYDRDVFVLATTAEESGLFGAQAFVEAPPIPREQFVAGFNFDTVALAPAASPIGFIGEGRTPLDTLVLDVIAQTKREVGDRDLAESFVRRQDGWALLDAGVPTVMLSSALGSRDIAETYLSGDYHRASDEAEGIELGGAVDDLLLHEELLRRVLNRNTYPAPEQADGG
ncbi:MAG: M28 family peptidase [Erythrobacter sp.]